MNNRRKFQFVEIDDELERKKIVDDVEILFMTVTPNENEAFLEYLNQ